MFLWAVGLEVLAARGFKKQACVIPGFVRECERVAVRQMLVAGHGRGK
jgi:hypothetical protein